MHAETLSGTTVSCWRRENRPHVRAEILSDPTSGVTLFAPDNNGINQTLSDLGLKLEGLLQDPKLVLSILQFHVLPSPVEVRQPPPARARGAALWLSHDQSWASPAAALACGRVAFAMAVRGHSWDLAQAACGRN